MSKSIIEQRNEIKNQAEKYIAEYLKCRKDFEYFIRNYVKLELGGGDVLFNPYEKQLELIHTIQEKRHIIITKSRQIGISTIVQAYCAWLSVFYKNIVIGIISKDGPEATDFARIIRGMIDKFPPWVGAKFVKNTERSYILKNGSKLYASPVPPISPDKTLRGKAITFLVIDEAAFVSKIDDAWTSIVPALSTNQKNAKKMNIPYGTIILSTPNKTMGVGKWYYSKWVSAKTGDNIFTPFQIHWKEIPELRDDPDWYDQQCKMLDHNQKKIQQELEMKFVATEGTFFEENTIEKLQDGKTDPIEKIKAKGGWIWKFQDPIPGKHYLIGVDTASEHGSDKSTIEIIDYETLEQVWEFQGKSKVNEFCQVVELAASIYYNCTIIIERNSLGNQVVEYMENTDHSYKLYKGKKAGTTKQKVNGLNNDASTRPLMIDALYSYISQFPNCIKSERLILELIGLVEKSSGKVEADKGLHDDLVLSLSFCHFVRKYDPPLMIEIDKYSQNSFMDVMDMNTENLKNKFDNKAIKKQLDDLIQDGSGGIVNTMEFFNVERG